MPNDGLKRAKQPLTYQQIWNTAKEAGLVARLASSGKTPWQTLGAILYVEVRDTKGSRFVKVGPRPARFFLKERLSELQSDTIEKIELEEEKKTESRTTYYRDSYFQAVSNSS